MPLYQRIIGKPLPQNTLILPLQYPLFGKIHHCIIFAQVKKELGRGASKRVEEAYVEELLGHIPLPDVASLKGQDIVLYRPRNEANIFIKDAISILKLKQRMLRNQNAWANIIKIKGYSFYLPPGYPEVEVDYANLLYKGNLKLSPDIPILQNILQASLDTTIAPGITQEITKEILQANELVSSPFMIGDVLPYSVEDVFFQIRPEIILHNVYQMVYTVAVYAAEGVYFRDLQPDNFRLTHKWEVKLIDPSYIDISVHPEKRFSLFIKQTTPEYLPNVFSALRRSQNQEKLVRYFGEFPEGVCIGMLERVLKRIFLPQYMGSRYDNLYKQCDSRNRIEAADKLKFEEDLDFFRDVVEVLPSPQHFVQYQESLVSYLERERKFPKEFLLILASLLTMLREFSYPVFTSTGCHSLLADSQRNPMHIGHLADYIASLSQEIYSFPALETRSDVESDIIFDDEEPSGATKARIFAVHPPEPPAAHPKPGGSIESDIIFEDEQPGVTKSRIAAVYPPLPTAHLKSPKSRRE
jgi:hypothetical protein